MIATAPGFYRFRHCTSHDVLTMFCGSREAASDALRLHLVHPDNWQFESFTPSRAFSPSDDVTTRDRDGFQFPIIDGVVFA